MPKEISLPILYAAAAMLTAASVVAGLPPTSQESHPTLPDGPFPQGHASSTQTSRSVPVNKPPARNAAAEPGVPEVKKPESRTDPGNCEQQERDDRQSRRCVPGKFDGSRPLYSP